METLSHPLSLKVTALKKSYAGVPALDDVSFEVRPGEIFGLLGPNGAGKTTCLESVLGLRTPDGGEIFFETPGGSRKFEEVRERIGTQLQFATLQDAITPREAIGLFSGFYEEPVPTDELLRRFGLVEKAKARFATLSGGQRQRLFLALAFLNRPQLLVLDEPTSGLDPLARRELHDLIRQLRRDAGCAIILSTHDLSEAEALCDRVAILHRGRIAALDTPATLMARCRVAQRLRVRFAASVPANLLAAFHAPPEPDKEGRWSIPTNDPNATLAQLLERLRGTPHEIQELQVDRASLEDVFVELTGSPFSTSTETAANPR